MVDTVSKSVRSKMMAANKGKNTKPELKLRQFLHSSGFRYRIHVRRLPGSPDLVLAKCGLVIFVHGCYWHQHKGCRYAYAPDVNHEKWQSKFNDTKRRDELTLAELQQLGWRVFVIWECGLTKGLQDMSLEWLLDAIKDPEFRFLSWPPVPN